jgi:hypothetical protein
MAPTGRHPETWPEVIAIAGDNSACPEPLHDVARSAMYRAVRSIPQTFSE